MWGFNRCIFDINSFEGTVSLQSFLKPFIPKIKHFPLFADGSDDQMSEAEENSPEKIDDMSKNCYFFICFIHRTFVFDAILIKLSIDHIPFLFTQTKDEQPHPPQKVHHLNIEQQLVSHQIHQDSSPERPPNGLRYDVFHDVQYYYYLSNSILRIQSPIRVIDLEGCKTPPSQF